MALYTFRKTLEKDENKWNQMKLKATKLYFALDTFFCKCPKHSTIRFILFGIVMKSEEISRKVSSVPLVFFPEFDSALQVGLSIFVRKDPALVFPVVEGLTGNANAFR